MNRIAVIMSVYAGDSLEYLTESIESLRSQTYTDFDIFIQEDGCVSPQIDAYLDELLADKQIAFLGKREDNRGLAYSLNELIAEVMPLGYEYLARMDADDICISTRMEEQYRFMESHPDVDVVGGQVIEFYENGKENRVNYAESHDAIRRQFASRTALHHVTAFLRRSFFEKAGVYDVENSKRNEDVRLWLAGFENDCRFHALDTVVLRFRMSEALFKRRSAFLHLWDTLLLEFRIVRTLNYPYRYYMWHIIRTLVKLMPRPVLKLIFLLR